MNEIKLLDKNTVDKIAAGEVIERPSSIVKELVENSIDAGADAISVEIRDGGISLIRVTDNGRGIPKEQIALAFLRHSTSKIQNASDLSFITTLGFRGEALSSISAVSKTELCSKTKDSLIGTIYKISGGVEQSVSDAALPSGTTMIIEDLFYNTPARLKFLKSAKTEAGYISDTIQRIALSRPDISFKFTSNGQLKLNTPGNRSLKDVIYSVFGRDIASNMLDVEDRDDILSISGFIGKPEISRGNRSFEFYFINGRFVKDRIIQKALEDAYSGYHMKGTFPFSVLNINTEPELVDVNVHPAKLEVRFYDEEAVYESVYNMIRSRISRRENIPQVSPLKDEREQHAYKPLPQRQYVKEPFEVKHAEKKAEAFSEEVIKDNIKVQDAALHKDLKQVQDAALHKEFKQTQDAGLHKDLIQAQDAALHKEISSDQKDIFDNENVFRQTDLRDAGFMSGSKERKEHRLIGEIFDTYWLVQYSDNLYIIDQHAAHEKVLYEKFMNDIRSGKHYPQKIMPPLIITLSIKEAETFEEYEKVFSDLGFEVEHYGGSEYAMSAVPQDLFSIDNRAMFLELLDDLSSSGKMAKSEILSDRVATAACKAAVKGGSRISFNEADSLIKSLLTLENPYNCPHGRPTMIAMSKYELEKKFKRII